MIQPRHPKRFELAYERALVRVFSSLLAGVEALELGELMRASSSTDLAVELAPLLHRLRFTLPTEHAIRLEASRHLTATSKRSRREFEQLAKRWSLPVTRDTSVRAELERALTRNVGLVSSVGPDVLERVEVLVRQGWQEGVSERVLAEQLRQTTRAGRSRARLIARDQIQKLNGELARIQQTEAGVSSYRWSTSKDERVRDSHRSRDGQIFSWTAPPPDGHPGEAIGCRCVAIPIITR